MNFKQKIQDLEKAEMNIELSLKKAITNADIEIKR
jgi:hypothetical protein